MAQQQSDSNPGSAHVGRVYRVDAARHAFRQVGDEGVVLDLTRSVYYGLNRTAGLLWPHLVAGATRDELVAAMTAAEPAALPAGQAAREIDDFLLGVQAQGLLTSAAGND